MRECSLVVRISTPKRLGRFFETESTHQYDRSLWLESYYRLFSTNNSSRIMRQLVIWGKIFSALRRPASGHSGALGTLCSQESTMTSAHMRCSNFRLAATQDCASNQSDSATNPPLLPPRVAPSPPCLMSGSVSQVVSHSLVHLETQGGSSPPKPLATSCRLSTALC